MSTKIYYAARAPVSRIVDFIDYFHDAMEKGAEHFFEGMMSAVKEEALGKVPDHIKGKSKGERAWRCYKQWDIVSKAIREGLKIDKSFDVYSCGFNLWVYKKHVYAMPIGANWAMATFDVKKLPDWIEDYCYFNNTDEPKHVTRKQWEARRATWDQICTGNDKASHNARRLYHDVIDFKNSMGLFDFAYPRYQRPLHQWVDKNRSSKESADG